MHKHGISIEGAKSVFYGESPLQAMGEISRSPLPSPLPEGEGGVGCDAALLRPTRFSLLRKEGN